jgi:hypothetical protein
MSVIGGWSQPVDATLYLEGEMECGLMAHKFHRGFTAAEKTELWDRWKRGESLKAIGRAFGKRSSSIYFFGGSAWWDSSCPAASLPAGIDAHGTRGDFQRRDGTSIEVTGPRSVVLASKCDDHPAVPEQFNRAVFLKPMSSDDSR